MSLQSLESAIASEARVVFANRKLLGKDLIEWRTAPIEPQAGEVVAHLPLNGVWVAVLKEHDKRDTP